MKVLVIDASIGRVLPIIPIFKEGEIIDITPAKRGRNYSVDKEPLNSMGRKNVWAEDRFIPMSDKDEQVILFNRLEDQVIANLCEELGDERNFIGEDIYH